jgi:undecaprenyl-diphosphatase
MTILEAIFLGIIQGASEFLPISSSGHMILVPTIFGLDAPNLTVVAIAHIGTLLAVLIYFWRDLWAIAGGVLAGLQQRQPLGSTEARLGWFIVVGTIPAAVLGLTLEDYFDSIFGTPLFAAGFLLVTAVLLVAGERMLSGHKTPAKMGWTDAILIGCFQALALLPGISRSGSTIVGGLWRGLDRPTAARFSFLLSIPATAGVGLLKTIEVARAPDLAAVLPGLIACFVAAGIVGYACIHFLMEWLKKRSLYGFAIYTASFGLIYLLVAAFQAG